MGLGGLPKHLGDKPEQLAECGARGREGREVGKGNSAQSLSAHLEPQSSRSSPQIARPRTSGPIPRSGPGERGRASGLFGPDPRGPSLEAFGAPKPTPAAAPGGPSCPLAPATPTSGARPAPLPQPGRRRPHPLPPLPAPVIPRAPASLGAPPRHVPAAAPTPSGHPGAPEARSRSGELGGGGPGAQGG